MILLETNKLLIFSPKKIRIMSITMSIDLSARVFPFMELGNYTEERPMDDLASIYDLHMNTEYLRKHSHVRF